LSDSISISMSESIATLSGDVPGGNRRGYGDNGQPCRVVCVSLCVCVWVSRFPLTEGRARKAKNVKILFYKAIIARARGLTGFLLLLPLLLYVTVIVVVVVVGGGGGIIAGDCDSGGGRFSYCCCRGGVRCNSLSPFTFTHLDDGWKSFGLAGWQKEIDNPGTVRFIFVSGIYTNTCTYTHIHGCCTQCIVFDFRKNRHLHISWTPFLIRFC